MPFFGRKDGGSAKFQNTIKQISNKIQLSKNQLIKRAEDFWNLFFGIYL
jgi:hypothetical protein